MMVLRVIAAHRRLAGAAICGGIAFLFLPAAIPPLTRAIAAWDFGCIVFLILIAVMFSRDRLTDMAADALAQEEGEWTVFFLAAGAAAASVAALVSDYATSDTLPGTLRNLHAAMVVVTLLLSWLTMHTLFALRYAHGFYARAAEKAQASGESFHGGLRFPGDALPDYWDFFYFALVLGMACQTADVAISSRRMRRLATAHGFVSFVFNAVILALSVNFGATLLSS